MLQTAPRNNDPEVRQPPDNTLSNRAPHPPPRIVYNDRQRGRLQSDGEYVDIIDSSYKDDAGIRYDISGRLDGQGYLYFGKQGNATHANQGQAMERYDRNRLSLPMPKQKRTFSYEKPVTTSNVDQRKVIRN